MRLEPARSMLELRLMRLFQKALSLSFVITVVAAASACTLNPTAKEAAEKYAPALCQRLQACQPAAYMLAYPMDSMGNTSQCEQKALSAIKDPEARDACSDKEVDQCVTDTKAETCDKITMSLTDMNPSEALAASCSKC